MISILEHLISLNLQLNECRMNFAFPFKAGFHSLMEYSKIELRLNSVVGYLAGETEEQRQLEILGTDIA